MNVFATRAKEMNDMVFVGSKWGEFPRFDRTNMNSGAE